MMKKEIMDNKKGVFGLPPEWTIYIIIFAVLLMIAAMLYMKFKGINLSFFQP